MATIQVLISGILLTCGTVPVTPGPNLALSDNYVVLGLVTGRKHDGMCCAVVSENV